MGIIDRTSNVLRSNFNALLSRFEEPGRDLAWLLTEMREQIHAAQRELIRLMGERKRSEARVTELSQQIEQWEKRAELALRHCNDQLAREALAQKQRLLAERERLNAGMSELQQAAGDMKLEIDRMKRTHEGYSARQGTIAVQVSQSRAGGGVDALGAKPGSNNFEAFARLEHAIDADAALAVAEQELDADLDRTVLGTMTKTELDAQFEALESTDTPVAAEKTSASGSAHAEGQAQRIRVKP